MSLQREIPAMYRHVLLVLFAVLFLSFAGASDKASAQYSETSNDTSETHSVVTFTGADFAPQSSYFYAGLLVSLQGDFGRDGFVLKALGGLGDFHYFTILPPDVNKITKIDADSIAGDIMIGYQFTRHQVTTAIYVGLDYQDYDYNPDDPTNEIRGDEFGFKVALDAQTGEEIPFFAGFSGAYSTAFDAFYAQLRLGYNGKHFVIGPEGSISGDRSDDVQRLGGFFTYRFKLSPHNPAEITGYGGFQFADEENTGSPSGGEGGYGGVSFAVSY